MLSEDVWRMVCQETPDMKTIISLSEVSRRCREASLPFIFYDFSLIVSLPRMKVMENGRLSAYFRGLREQTEFYSSPEICRYVRSCKLEIRIKSQDDLVYFENHKDEEMLYLKERRIKQEQSFEYSEPDDASNYSLPEEEPPSAEELIREGYNTCRKEIGRFFNCFPKLCNLRKASLCRCLITPGHIKSLASIQSTLQLLYIDRCMLGISRPKQHFFPYSYTLPDRPVIRAEEIRIRLHDSGLQGLSSEVRRCIAKHFAESIDPVALKCVELSEDLCSAVPEQWSFLHNLKTSPALEALHLDCFMFRRYARHPLELSGQDNPLWGDRFANVTCLHISSAHGISFSGIVSLPHNIFPRLIEYFGPPDIDGVFHQGHSLIEVTLLEPLVFNNMLATYQQALQQLHSNHPNIHTLCLLDIPEDVLGLCSIRDLVIKFLQLRVLTLAPHLGSGIADSSESESESCVDEDFSDGEDSEANKDEADTGAVSRIESSFSTLAGGNKGCEYDGSDGGEDVSNAQRKFERFPDRSIRYIHLKKCLTDVAVVVCAILSPPSWLIQISSIGHIEVHVCHPTGGNAVSS